MATEAVVVDALPYFDVGYDDTGVREAVGIEQLDKSICFYFEEHNFNYMAYILMCLIGL